MKVVRVIASIVAVSMFCIGMCMYSLHDSIKGILHNQVVDFVLEGFVDTAFAMVQKPSKETMDTLPENVQFQFENIKSEIVKDEELQVLVQTYINAILDGSMHGNIEMPTIKEDVETIVRSSIPKVASISGIEMKPEEIDLLSTQLLQGIDVETMLNDTVKSMQAEMNSEQKNMLTVFYFIQSSKCMFLAIGTMLTGIIALILLKKNKYSWLRTIGIASMLGGGFLWLLSGLTKGIIEQNLQGESDIFLQFMKNSIHQFSQSGMQFFVLGIMFVIMYLIIKRKLMQTQKEV